MKTQDATPECGHGTCGHTVECTDNCKLKAARPYPRLEDVDLFPELQPPVYPEKPWVKVLRLVVAALTIGGMLAVTLLTAFPGD